MSSDSGSLLNEWGSRPDRSGGAHSPTAARGLVSYWVMLGACALCSALPAAASAQAPDEAWRTLETTHFRITFPEELGTLARRAAERAERAHAALSASLVEAPRGRIDLVLTDHVDVSNGFARVTPSNRVTIFARPPVDAFALGYFDDWLELVITHELAHIFHLDVTGPLGSLARKVIGRYPSEWPIFPGRAMPGWVIEGLATYYESALTDAGRTRGTNHEMTVRTAILEGAFESPDQASGDTPVWPGGSRPYVYGSLFFDYLLQRYGQERMGRFVNAVARQLVPYRINSASEDAFGVSISQAWDDWESSLRSQADELSRAPGADLTESQAVAHGARLALHAVVSPDGEDVAWASSDGRNDQQIKVARLDGTGARKLTRTNGLSRFSWGPDGTLIFAQTEFVDPNRIRSDLYALSSDGTVRRVTSGRRLSHPDVVPDGSMAVAVQEDGGANRLVEVDLATGAVEALTDFDLATLWTQPRVSPNGSWIAVSRWQPGARFDVVVLDREGNVAATVTDDRAIDATPAWSADGRWLTWSSDRSGVQNLYVVPIDPESGTPGEMRQVTHVLSGASHPAVSPDGRWLFYSHYHKDGWELVRIPFDPDSWFDPFPVDARFGGGGASAAAHFADSMDVPDAPYRAFRSLLPRFWEPQYQEGTSFFGTEVLKPGFGASIEGFDLVNRHSYSAWIRVDPDERRGEGRFGYTFAGLANPTFSVGVAQGYDASPLTGQLEGEALDTLFAVERERSVFSSIRAVRQRMRSFASLTVTGSYIQEDRELLERDLRPTDRFSFSRPDRRLVDGRVTVAFINTRTHAFSISREDGVRLSVQGAVRRDTSVPDSLAGAPGVDGGFNQATASFSAFKSLGGRGFANHVLALRASGGVASGPAAGAFHFNVGGASGFTEGITGLGLFGGPFEFFPVRGYERASRNGRYAFSLSAEYRFPLALVHRGLGMLPLHIDRVSGAVFADYGNAWGPQSGMPGFDNPRQSALASVGAEITTNSLPFWSGNLTVRVGGAVPLQDVQGQSTTATFYLRVGRSF